jgi:two-component system, NtrC family, sensor kinase
MASQLASSSLDPAVEARFRTLLDAIIDAAVIVGKDLRPLAWNAAYVNAVGLRPKRFGKLVAESQMRCRDMFELEVCDSDCLAARAFGARRAARMDEIGGHSKHSDAEEGGEKHAYRLIVNSVPLHNDQGEVTAVLEIYRDVTAEARIQERYKYLLEQERRRAEILEEQVRERTAELRKSLEELQATRQQLIQNEKLSSLGQLVAGIAHEINNPINFIYGNTDFLKQYVGTFLDVIRFVDELGLPPAERERLDAKKKELDFDYVSEDTVKLLSSIRNGAERAAAIVRDLRSFIHSRSVERAPVSLERAAETTLGLVTHEIRGRITITRQYGKDIPDILGHEGQLCQVLMNLIVNAIQAIKDKGEIIIRTRRTQDGGVAIDVTDNGMGISEADQLKVFDPFFTTKPVGQGTGLGLSISYSIVDAHGGRLTVQSEVGKGATFTLALPASTVVTVAAVGAS